MGPRPRVVVVGGGFGGLAGVRALARAPDSSATVLYARGLRKTAPGSP
jgi:NADH dehydrogenase FAD-containing subunit